MKITHIPCLEDNYAYLIVDESTNEAAAVDPVEPEKIIGAAKAMGADLKLVLTTHHHWDHAGGNEKMKDLVPGIKVYGGSIDKVKGCTNELENGDRLTLGADIKLLALHTPCHTKGHISYFVTSKEEEDPAVFTGDTLFIAGCGKFFEGTAEQMYESLCVTLGSLPKPTRVFCGHEYTEKNLKFALTIEPENEHIKQKYSWAQKQREAKLPTIPSTRGTVVLSEFSNARGNFDQVARRILEKIPTQHNNKMSYVYERHIFHYLVADQITYLCMADEEFGRRIPFAFLEDLKNRFQATYGERGKTAIAFAMNEDFSRIMKNLMDYYSHNPNADRIRNLKGEVDEVKTVMVQNIEKVLERGERIELLVDKTENLSQNAFKFKKSSTALKRSMWWKNIKLTIIIAVIVLVVIYIIVALACGGLAFQRCVNS